MLKIMTMMMIMKVMMMKRRRRRRRRRRMTTRMIMKMLIMMMIFFEFATMTPLRKRGWNRTCVPIDINPFITHPAHKRLYHKTRVYAPYSLRTECWFFYVPQESEQRIARNRGHFAPVINCQRNLIFKMADKNYRSQGKRIPCDFLNNLSSVDLFYEEKSWN